MKFSRESSLGISLVFIQKNAYFYNSHFVNMLPQGCLYTCNDNLVCSHDQQQSKIYTTFLLSLQLKTTPPYSGGRGGGWGASLVGKRLILIRFVTLTIFALALTSWCAPMTNNKAKYIRPFCSLYNSKPLPHIVGGGEEGGGLPW